MNVNEREQKAVWEYRVTAFARVPSRVALKELSPARNELPRGLHGKSGFFSAVWRGKEKKENGAAGAPGPQGRLEET